MLSFRMPGKSYGGPWVPLSGEEEEARGRLEADVRHLAGRIGERNSLCPAALEAAAGWIEGRLRELGYAPGRQEFEAAGGRFCNIEAEIGGGGGTGIVVIGAHYDSAPGTPGANDNGSGVAALLEIARDLAGSRPSRAVRFVAFTNEEAPFFRTRDMGSLVYARRCRERGEEIAGMLSLETIGYYSDEPGSQKYPAPFGLLYPTTGNFLAFVGNSASSALTRAAIGEFRATMPFPSEGLCAPDLVPGVGWSDHWSFWECGYPAFMVTDTALFRYAEYHASSDTADQLVYDRMARAVSGIRAVVCAMAAGRIP